MCHQQLGARFSKKCFLRTWPWVSASSWNILTNSCSSNILTSTCFSPPGFFNPRKIIPTTISKTPKKTKTRVAANKPNAYGVFFAPGIKSTLIPNSPVMVERKRLHPPKTARLWVIQRLLSWIKIYKRWETYINIGGERWNNWHIKCHLEI